MVRSRLDRETPMCRRGFSAKHAWPCTELVWPAAMRRSAIRQGRVFCPRFTWLYQLLLLLACRWLRCAGAPVSGLSFVDEDSRAGFLDGLVVWEPPEDAAGISGYAVFLAVDSENSISGRMEMRFEGKNSVPLGTNELRIPSGTSRKTLLGKWCSYIVVVPYTTIRLPSSAWVDLEFGTLRASAPLYDKSNMLPGKVSLKSLALTDADARPGLLSGTALWEEPEDDENLAYATSFAVYLAADTEGTGQAAVGEVSRGTNQLAVPEGTRSDCFVLVYAKNDVGQAAEAEAAPVGPHNSVASCPLVFATSTTTTTSFSMPAGFETQILHATYVDADPRPYRIEGVISWLPPADTGGASQYAVFLAHDRQNRHGIQLWDGETVQPTVPVGTNQLNIFKGSWRKTLSDMHPANWLIIFKCTSKSAGSCEDVDSAFKLPLFDNDEGVVPELPAISYFGFADVDPAVGVVSGRAEWAVEATADVGFVEEWVLYTALDDAGTGEEMVGAVRREATEIVIADFVATGQPTHLLLYSRNRFGRSVNFASTSVTTTTTTATTSTTTTTATTTATTSTTTTTATTTSSTSSTATTTSDLASTTTSTTTGTSSTSSTTTAAQATPDNATSTSTSSSTTSTTTSEAVSQAPVDNGNGETAVETTSTTSTSTSSTSSTTTLSSDENSTTTSSTTVTTATATTTSTTEPSAAPATTTSTTATTETTATTVTTVTGSSPAEQTTTSTATTTSEVARTTTSTTATSTTSATTATTTTTSTSTALPNMSTTTTTATTTASALTAVTTATTVTSTTSPAGGDATIVTESATTTDPADDASVPSANATETTATTQTTTTGSTSVTSATTVTTATVATPASATNTTATTSTTETSATTTTATTSSATSVSATTTATPTTTTADAADETATTTTSTGDDDAAASNSSTTTTTIGSVTNTTTTTSSTLPGFTVSKITTTTSLDEPTTTTTAAIGLSTATTTTEGDIILHGSTTTTGSDAPDAAERNSTSITEATTTTSNETATVAPENAAETSTTTVASTTTTEAAETPVLTNESSTTSATTAASEGSTSTSSSGGALANATMSTTATTTTATALAEPEDETSSNTSQPEASTTTTTELDGAQVTTVPAQSSTSSTTLLDENATATSTTADAPPSNVTTTSSAMPTDNETLTTASTTTTLSQATAHITTSQSTTSGEDAEPVGNETSTSASTTNTTSLQEGTATTSTTTVATTTQMTSTTATNSEDGGAPEDDNSSSTTMATTRSILSADGTSASTTTLASAANTTTGTAGVPEGETASENATATASTTTTTLAVVETSTTTTKSPEPTTTTEAASAGTNETGQTTTTTTTASETTRGDDGGSAELDPSNATNTSSSSSTTAETEVNETAETSTSTTTVMEKTTVSTATALAATSTTTSPSSTSAPKPFPTTTTTKEGQPEASTLPSSRNNTTTLENITGGGDADWTAVLDDGNGSNDSNGSNESITSNETDLSDEVAVPPSEEESICTFALEDVDPCLDCLRYHLPAGGRCRVSCDSPDARAVGFVYCLGTGENLSDSLSAGLLIGESSCAGELADTALEVLQEEVIWFGQRVWCRSDGAQPTRPMMQAAVAALLNLTEAAMSVEELPCSVASSRRLTADSSADLLPHDVTFEIRPHAGLEAAALMEQVALFAESKQLQDAFVEVMKSEHGVGVDSLESIGQPVVLTTETLLTEEVPSTSTTSPEGGTTSVSPAPGSTTDLRDEGSTTPEEGLQPPKKLPIGVGGKRASSMVVAAVTGAFIGITALFSLLCFVHSRCQRRRRAEAFEDEQEEEQTQPEKPEKPKKLKARIGGEEVAVLVSNCVDPGRLAEEKQSESTGSTQAPLLAAVGHAVAPLQLSEARLPGIGAQTPLCNVLETRKDLVRAARQFWLEVGDVGFVDDATLRNTSSPTSRSRALDTAYREGVSSTSSKDKKGGPPSQLSCSTTEEALTLSGVVIEDGKTSPPLSPRVVAWLELQQQQQEAEQGGLSPRQLFLEDVPDLNSRRQRGGACDERRLCATIPVCGTHYDDEDVEDEAGTELVFMS
eukprot:TRINITY_DN3124_c0_g1_i1.p1 TRINITY_DN3124_c0_g1~~TRINITY_DN3124_c0_g1_i1.p1  ORF type:complete len:2061 (+),score=428.64 TRINITY_DN3124_c0_g1_i1:195-6377(+)